MRYIEYALIAALIALVFATAFYEIGSVKSSLPIGVAFTVGTGARAIACCSGGRCWATVNGGICDVVDRPK